jgi:hypothetical protein
MRARMAPVRIICAIVGLAVSMGLVRVQVGHAQSPELVSFAKITSATPLRDGIELRDGSTVMRITALRDDVVRIRASHRSPSGRCLLGGPAGSTFRVNRSHAG